MNKMLHINVLCILNLSLCRKPRDTNIPAVPGGRISSELPQLFVTQINFKPICFTKIITTIYISVKTCF